MRPISFRPIRDSDHAFLQALYASTRWDVEFAELGQQEKRDFLEMQFRAQHSHYQTHFSDAAFLIVLSGKTRIGRLYVHRTQEHILVIDIALLPEHRGQGIGTQLMSEILAEGQRTGKPVRIHVEHISPALPFYERLGFVAIDDIGTHLYMECKPAAKRIIL